MRDIQEIKVIETSFGYADEDLVASTGQVNGLLAKGWVLLDIVNDHKMSHADSPENRLPVTNSYFVLGRPGFVPPEPAVG